MAVRLDIVPETGSTNADLLARIAGGEQLAEGYWLIADRQTAGRGRHGRHWLDAPGNFMGSTAVRLGPHDPPASSLSFVAALAVHTATSGRIAQPSALMLKWPNDILLSGAKFCGILLERQGDYAVIGIGVNLAEAPQVPGRMVKSLADIGAAPDRDLFAQDLAESFATELERWRQYGTGPVFTRWLAAAHPRGTALSLQEGGTDKVTGSFDGLEDDGALVLRLADGTTRVIHAGEVMLEGSH